MATPVYPSDLTDDQWTLLEPMLPPPKPGGRPRSNSLRTIINGIFYLVRSGCSWRMLPRGFGPWGTVHFYYWTFRTNGLWEKIHDTLREEVRHKAGRKRTPSAAILDSKSVKTTEKRGSMAMTPAINGRKRHLLVDTMGLLLTVVVHGAQLQDRDGGRLVLSRTAGRFKRLRKIWADGGYAGQLLNWTQEKHGWEIAIVKRSDRAVGFEVLPRRWVVERTFGWIGRYRRHSKDYEYLPASGEAMIRLSMINLMLHRLAPEDVK